jgi:hypothetical protein
MVWPHFVLVAVRVVTLVLALAPQLVGQVAQVQEVLQPQDQRLVRLERLVKVMLAVAVQDMAAQITLAGEVAVQEPVVVDRLLAPLQVMAEQAHQTALQGLR